MNKIENQILETWRIHNRAMIYFIENLPEGALAATLSTRGGRDVARQLAHANNVRYKRLTAIAKKKGFKIVEFDTKESPDRETLMSAFKQSGKAMEEHIKAAIDNDGLPSNFKLGVVPMLGYYISHECHHRGHALLTIKQAGIPLNDKLRMYIWDWKNI